LTCTTTRGAALSRTPFTCFGVSFGGDGGVNGFAVFGLLMMTTGFTTFPNGVVVVVGPARTSPDMELDVVVCAVVAAWVVVPVVVMVVEEVVVVSVVVVVVHEHPFPGVLGVVTMGTVGAVGVVGCRVVGAVGTAPQPFEHAA